MEILYIIIFFILGVSLGSFYNVVGLRLANGGSILKPKHSYCPTCENPLKTKDLVPVFSYIYLKGKCRYCEDKISWIYPLMELLTGLLFAMSYYSFGFSLDLITALSLVSLFIIIIVSDITYYIIIDEVLIFFGSIIAINNFLMYDPKVALLKLGHGLIMFLVMLLIMLIGNKIFKTETLGGGDIKLMFISGLVLSPLLGVFSIFLASLLALPISLVLLHKYNQRMIPFGPFLMFAILVLYFMKIDVQNIIEFFKII